MYQLYYTLTDKRGYLTYVDAAIFIGFQRHRQQFFVPLFAFSRTINTNDERIDERTLLSWHFQDYAVPDHIDDFLQSYKRSITFTDEMIHSIEDHMLMPGRSFVLPEEYIPVSDLGAAFDAMLSRQMQSPRQKIAHPSIIENKRELFIRYLTPYMKNILFVPSNLPSTSL